MLKTSPLIVFQNLRKLLLLLVAITLPLHIQINSYLIGLLALASLLDLASSKNSKRAEIRISPLVCFLMVGAYFIWLVIGVSYSQNTSLAWKDITQISSLLIFPIIAFVNRDLLNKKFIKLFLYSFMASVISLILVAEVIQIALIIKKNEPFIYLFRWRHSANKLVDFVDLSPNYFSMYCVFLTLAVVFSELKSWLKVVLFSILTFFILHLVNRTGIISMGAIILGILVWIFYRNRGDKKMWFIPLSIVAALLLLMMVKPTWIKKKLVDRNFKNEEGSIEIVLDNRIPRWGAVWAVIEENTLLGVGTGDVSNAFVVEYEKRNLQNDFDKKYHAHNQYLQSWASNGIIGLLLFLFPLIYGILYSIKKRNYLLLSFLLTFMVFSITESTLKRQKGVVFYSMFQSILLIHLLKKDEEILT